MSGPVFNAGAIKASASIDRSEFIRDLRSMQAEIRSFERNKISLGVKIDRQAIKADLAALKSEISRSGDAKIPIGANTSQARRDIAAFRAYVKGLSATNLSIGASLAQAKRDVAEYKRTLRGQNAVNIDVGANTAKARAEIRELKRLGGNIDIDVDAKTIAAMLKLRQIQNMKRDLNTNPAHVNVAIGSDAGRVIGLIGLIIAGLSSIAALAPAAAAGLAGVFAVGGIGAQVIGALGFGLSGVGDAYKAMGQESQRAATSVGKAHTGIDSSLRSLQNTYRSTQRSIDDAERSYAHTATLTARQVADAHRSYEQTVKSSARSVEDAERSLARAQEDARRAQEDLNRARQEAVTDLEDLNLRLRDTALSEKEANIRLIEAQNELRAAQATPGTSTLDLQKSQLAVERAQLSVDQAKQSYKETSAEATKAAQNGVEGSDKVVAAKEREASATQQVEDAERSLRQTRDDAAEANANALRQMQEAEADAAYSMEEAARNVAQAHDDAAHSIADALAAVKDAQESAANAGVAGANRVEYAMSKLSPEAREFAMFLYNDVRPALNSVSDAVAKSMLPDMEKGMRQLLTLQPELQTGLAGTGAVIGRLTIAGANMVTTGPWRRDFADIMAANNRMLYNFGGTTLFYVDAARSLYAVSLPLLETFSQWVLTSAKLFDEWIQGKRATGELSQFMAMAAERAKQLWDFFVQLVSTSYELGKALMPVGETMLAIATAILEFIKEMSIAHPQLVQFTAYAIIAFAAFTNLGKAILALGSATRLGVAGFARIGEILTNASVAAGTFTEKVTGSAAAGTKVMTAGEKLVGVLNKVGAALPFVGAAAIAAGIAYDAMRSKSDELADSVTKGSVSMSDAIRQEAAQLETRDKWFGMYVGSADSATRAQHAYAEATQNVTQAVQSQLSQMAPLERAQAQVAISTNNYQEAMRKYGINSGQAAMASAQLAEASQKLKTEQERAADATKSLVDRLAEQRDIMLGVIDAEIGYEDATDRLTQAVSQNGKTVDIHTESGRNNLRALNDLARSGLAYIKQLQDQGTSTEDVTAKQEELKNRLYDGAIQLGMTKEEARKYVEQLNLVPKDVTTNFWANTQAAWDQINKFITDTKNAIATYQDGNVTVKFWADTGNILNQAKASGGPIMGPGTGRSDSVPLLASHGEHMWTASEVSAVGGHGAMMNLRQQARSGSLRGFADGGPIGNITTLFNAVGIPEAEDKYVKAISDAIINYYAATMMGPGPGSGVERWRGVGLQALQIAGQGADNIGRLLMQMNTESGGNPEIVNKWDVNWQKGTPSVGLMQVIGPTYQHYKHPQFDVGPYLYGTSTNPMANILSSIRYTLAAYGSLSAGWQGHGYDQGGLWHGGLGFNFSGLPERVLSPQQTRAFENLIHLLDRWTRSPGTNANGATPAASSALVQQVTGDDFQPTIGTVVMQVPYGASPQEYVEHLDFELQYRKKKGVYSR